MEWGGGWGHPPWGQLKHQPAPGPTALLGCTLVVCGSNGHFFRVAKEQMRPWVRLQPSGVHSCLVPTPELLLRQHHAWGDWGLFP